jgi:hypothetical protein
VLVSINTHTYKIIFLTLFNNGWNLFLNKIWLMRIIKVRFKVSFTHF